MGQQRGRLALPAAEGPQWPDPLAVLPSPSSPLILMQNGRGGRD